MTFRSLAQVLAAALLSACASIRAPDTCAVGDAAVQDSLYFGTATPAGTLTAEQWSAFLADTVTPRFPLGLTVAEATGQWRGADGRTVHESAYVLLLVHPDTSENERLVSEIVARYKQEFQQEAVLRVKARACVSF